jgi:DNA recombination protein RmuC
MTELVVVVILLQVGILVMLVSRKSGSSEVMEEFSRFRREVNEIAAGMRADLDSKLEQVQGRSGDLVEEFSRFRREANEITAGMRKDLDAKLELMRATVDEKLQTTLEKRLSESFKQVSERLEQVHQGLGEMQTLAVGVGDLKKVLGNVKTRGTWGEVQLGLCLSRC